MRSRRHLAALAICTAAILGGVLPAWGAGDQLRTFKQFDVFHLGKQWRGLPQTETSGPSGDDRGPYVVGFIYGDCDDPPCTPPLEIQNWKRCRRPRHTPPEQLTVRGAPAALFAGPGFFDSLEIYTRRTTVVIFADSRKRALRAANDLRAINAPIGAKDPLPPGGRCRRYRPPRP